MLLAASEFLNTRPSEAPRETTSALPHHRRHDLHRRGSVPANTLEEIIQEVAATRVTERGTRADDKRSEAAMEDRKKEGYF